MVVTSPTRDAGYRVPRVTSKRRILIVEDEQDVAGLIKHAVERTGDTEAEVVGSGDTALKAVANRLPDLVVLDLNLPVLDGVEVCRILRSRADTKWLPIIILTARGGEDDRVTGLEIGADDYISKPFSLRELTARIRAVLRRSAVPSESVVPVYAGALMMADFDAVRVTVEGEPIRLTRREFELLRFLVQNKNRVVSRDRLLERVWGYDRLVETRSVDVHVGRLRNKLGPAARQVETVVGLGYRFVD
ncbi:MAG TPA: response regulator transcription factor [Vicinamibacterales bacterium]|jgi:DNA-binding response OmpR family regulator